VLRTCHKAPTGEGRFAGSKGDDKEAEGVDELVVDGRLPSLNKSVALSALQRVGAKGPKQHPHGSRQAAELEPQRMDCV